MTSPLQTQIWRTVAFFLVVGAAGLGAYYAFIQRPIELHNQKFADEIAEMKEQLAEPVEHKEARTIAAAELDPACARYRELVGQLGETDAMTQRFAVEEITRRTGLDHLALAQPEAITLDGLTDHRQRIELRGEPKAIQRVVQNLITSERAGVATFDLKTAPDAADDEKKSSRRPAPALLEGVVDLHAYLLDDAQRALADICSEPAP